MKVQAAFSHINEILGGSTHRSVRTSSWGSSADEGSPIIIGEGADIGNRVTFHALAGTELVVGDFFTVDDDAVIHGPLQVGHRVIVGEASVVFRVIIGDDVVIGNGVILQGPAGEGLSLYIPPGTRIPDGSVVTDESTLRQATGI